MYESFFGLKEKAFNLTPDPDFLYLNERTRLAFDDILSGIERREGFALIIGDVGTGKTTLCCALLERIERQKNIFAVLIQNPMLSELDILRSILQDLRAPQIFGAAWTRDMTKRELIDCLNTILAERARADAFTVLIIDESQNLSLEMLEQLRLLSNLETTKKKLLQIILIGQPELRQKLAKLRQLSQRISVRFETQPLSRDDTEKYIRHRLHVAGESHKIQFGPGAFDAIHRNSRGYPRLINLICDRSLREACSIRSFTIAKQTVRKAVARLAGNDDVLARKRSRTFRIAATALIVIAAALLLLLLNGRKPNPAKSPPANPVNHETAAAPEPALPPDEPRMQQQAAEARLPAPEALKTQKPTEYFLQVYSFRNAASAEETMKQMKGLNLPCFIEYRAVEGDNGWYGVYVGPFDDLGKAQRADLDVRAATGTSPVLRERVARPAKTTPDPREPEITSLTSREAQMAVPGACRTLRLRGHENPVT